MLHTEPPPKATLDRILRPTVAGSGSIATSFLSSAYLRSLTLIFRNCVPILNRRIGMRRGLPHGRKDLSSSRGWRKGFHATYPNCLPKKTVRGLFGEVMCGIVAETYDLVGSKQWRVPIFLFREHAPVARYIFDLVRDPARIKEVHGRPGNDFIGLELAADGTVRPLSPGRRSGAPI